MLLSLGASAATFNNNNPESDTVILKFGNNSQIIVYVDNKEDLEDLTRYDINRILEELNLQVNSLSDTVEVLEIKDESGKKYLKDTIVVYKVKPSVTVSSWEDDDNDKKDKKYRYYPRSRFDFITEIGLNNWLEDGKFPIGSEPYALNPLGSWYWNLGPTWRTQVAGPFFLDMGLSSSWNVYRFDDHRTRINTENGVVFERDTLASGPRKSKFANWFIQAKFIPMFAIGSNHRSGWRLWNNIDKGFRIGAGVYGGYRIWSRTKYKDNGGKVKNTANYLLNNVKYGVRGQIGFRGVDFFIEYDLSRVFQENQGAPNLNRLQFGVTF